MAAGDREVQINVYPINPSTGRSDEFRHKGTITLRATNYIDIICEDGSIALTLYRNRETNKFEFGVLISKVDPESGDLQERRVYRGNLFDEPFVRPPMTDAERQAHEEEMSAMGAPRFRRTTVQQLAPAVPVVPEDEHVDFTTGEDEPPDDDDDIDDEVDDPRNDDGRGII